MPSLQDQLLNAGLVDKKKAKKLKHEKQNFKKKVKHGLVEDDTLKQDIAKEKERKRLRDIELNKIKQQAVAQREQQGMVKQMLQQHSVDDYRGDLDFNYTFEGKVKKISVGKEIRAGLIDGRLAICTLDEHAYIISKDKAERIAEVDESLLALMNDSVDSEIDENDPYADYQIPDDLVW